MKNEITLEKFKDVQSDMQKKNNYRKSYSREFRCTRCNNVTANKTVYSCRIMKKNVSHDYRCDLIEPKNKEVRNENK